MDTNYYSEETTSQQLFSHLFEACNILRGPINQDDYKSYVTPILFFKRLSDVYDEETQIALDESDGDEEYAAFPENHSFVIPEGCHWKDVREVSENVGTAIVNAMYGIERANPDRLAGVFSSFDDANWTDKTKLSDERLKDLVEHMSKIRVGNNDYAADVMGDAYEYLIKKFADLSKKNAGEFYTPRTIVKLLVMLMAPQAGETVYDPACGTGGMLIEAIRYMHNDQLTYGKIYGQEKNPDHIFLYLEQTCYNSIIIYIYSFCCRNFWKSWHSHYCTSNCYYKACSSRYVNFSYINVKVFWSS